MFDLRKQRGVVRQPVGDEAEKLANSMTALAFENLKLALCHLEQACDLREYARVGFGLERMPGH